MEPELAPLGRKILAHWTAHRPAMVAKLKRQGKLVEAVFDAQERMLDEQESLERKGVEPNAALEMAREEAFLPDEETTPLLGETQEAWTDPTPMETTD